jgi:hypothetical protein
MSITPKERGILRELAHKQAEIASLPIMAEREKRWYDLNDGIAAHPLVTMEYHGPASDVYPPLVCETPLAKALEAQMARQLFKHGFYKDDRWIPGYVTVGVPNWMRPFDFTPDTNYVKKSDGTRDIGYMFRHAVHDLEADFSEFKPSAMAVDTGLAKAGEAKAQAEDIVGDILPVKLEGTPFGLSPGHALIRMMSTETMFSAMLDYPDLFHRIMRRLTDDALAFMDAMEAGGALVPANGATRIAMDTYCFSRELTGPAAGQPVTMNDVWCYANVQESVGLSPSQFDEFFFAYIHEFSARCGLVGFGCCEPVHAVWEPCLSRMKNLRKLSISPWCDEAFIGDAIRGKKIVYHRKPFPNFFSNDAVFDEDAFRKHMARSARAARGCPLEVTFRDIYGVCGEPRRLVRAVEITREVFADEWHS